MGGVEADLQVGRLQPDHLLVSTPPVNSAIRADVTSRTCVTVLASTSRGANTTRSARVVSVVTIVRAESDVGLPNAPIESVSAIRSPTCTSSLRMPAYL